jgi:hypothetical protein
MPRIISALLALVVCTSVAFALYDMSAISPSASPRIRSDAPTLQDKKEQETERQRLERKARKLLDVNGVKAVQEHSFNQMLEQFKKMNLPDEFAEKFKAKFDIDHVMDINVRIYADELDEETLDALITFLQSTSGRKFAEAFPEITRKALAAGMEYGAQIGKEVAEDMHK